MDMEPFAVERSFQALTGQYREILLDYLASPGEQDRNAVFDVAYEAAVQGFSLQEIVELHHDVLLDLFDGSRLTKDTVRLAGELLRDVMGIYYLLCLRPRGQS